jgi:hypothetical protein
LTSFSKAEISPLGQYQVIRAGSGQSLCLRQLLKSWTEAAVWTLESSLFRNQSWDDNPDLFGVKIARDLARAIHFSFSIFLLFNSFAVGI